MIFGLLDCGMALLFFLPLFGEKNGDGFRSVSLPMLTGAAPYMRVLYFLMPFLLLLWGILTPALQKPLWHQYKMRVSFLLSIAATLLFIVGTQPYAATFTFVFLVIKVIFRIKRA